MRDISYILEHPGLARVADDLAAMARNSIRITTFPVDESKIPLGASKIGGHPDLPPEIEWPTAFIGTSTFRVGSAILTLAPQIPDEDRPPWAAPLLPDEGVIHLPFVAQLRLSDPAAYDVDRLLPPSGMLYFFYNDVSYERNGVTLFESAGGLNTWKVSYFDRDPSTLTRSAFPENLPDEGRYGACRLRFRSELTLPDVETSMIGEVGSQEARLMLTEQEWNTYHRLRYKLRSNKAIHQMLGYCDDPQSFTMECSYKNVREHYFPELVPFESLPEEAKQSEFELGRLLLQVSDVKKANIWFGRDGILFFFIREQDLRARNFGKVWATV